MTNSSGNGAPAVNVEKHFKLADLDLDLANYRVNKQQSQREATLALISEQGQKLVALAEDILDNGLNPIDRLMVAPAAYDATKHTVIEGNRRIAALKLVLEPDVALDTAVHNGFRRLNKRKAEVPSEVTAYVVPTKEHGYLWIQRKHDIGLKGAGTESWTRIARLRAYAARGSSAPIVDVLEFVTAHDGLTEEAQERVFGHNFSISNLERLLNSKYVRTQLQLKPGPRYLASTADKRWVLRVLREMVETVALEEFDGEKFTVDRIKTAELQKQFFDEIVERYPKPNRGSREWQICATTEMPDDPGPKKGVKQRKRLHGKTTDRNRLIPSKCAVRPSTGRANDIFTELRKLELSAYRNAVAILLRVFLEFSVEEYMRRNKVMAVTPKDELKRKLQEVATDMENNSVMSRKELHGIRKAASDPNSIVSTVTLNAYVHNSKFYPSVDDLRTSWDNLEPFIEKLWSA